MPFRTRVLKLGLAVLAGTILGLTLAPLIPGDSSSCSDASFVELHSEPIEVKVGFYWYFTFNAVLVGPREPIQALSPEDKAIVMNLLSDLVREHHLTFIGRAKNPDYRRLACDRINASIPSSPVTDIHFTDLSFSETIPTVD